MEYGMPFLMETDTLEECARLCSHLGLDFIELNMNFPQCQLPELQADPAAVDHGSGASVFYDSSG